MRRSTSSPLIFGSFKSSSTSSGKSCPDSAPAPNRYSRAAAPSRTTTTELQMLLSSRAMRVSSSSSGLTSTNRIVEPFTRPPRHMVQGEVERRAAVHHTLRADPPTVAVHDSLDRGQADARALELVG